MENYSTGLEVPGYSLDSTPLGRAMAAHSPPLMPNKMLGMRYEELTLKDAQDYEKNLSDHDRGVSMRNLAAQCLV